MKFFLFLILLSFTLSTTLQAQDPAPAVQTTANAATTIKGQIYYWLCSSTPVLLMELLQK
jgi:hypothetical protein